MKVFITGTTSGLGKALAKKFISNGCMVWGVGRKPFHKITGMPVNLTDNYTYTYCDLENTEDIKTLYRAMKIKNFDPEVLIFNAASMDSDFINLNLDYKKFTKIFNVNVFSIVNLISLFLSDLQNQGNKIFIAISSLSAYRSLTFNKIAYPSSKAALSMLFESLRIEFANSKIKFITIHPGRISYKGFSPFIISYEKAADKIYNHLKRKRNKSTVDFPLMAAMIHKFSKIVPDRTISKLLKIIRHSKYFKKIGVQD